MNGKALKLQYHFFLLIVVLAACGSPEEKKASESKEELDSLKDNYATIIDSLNTSWAEMIQDDDKKIADMKRLLDEVTYTNVYDKQQVDQLYTEVENLKQIRYDSMSMSDSDGIDRYDSAIAEVIYKVSNLAANHPKYESYPLMGTLINDIIDANDKVILYRIRYDDYAQEYNKFIEKNKTLMPEIAASDSIWHRPLFQLIIP